MPSPLKCTILKLCDPIRHNLPHLSPSITPPKMIRPLDLCGLKSPSPIGYCGLNFWYLTLFDDRFQMFGPSKITFSAGELVPITIDAQDVCF